MDGATRDLTFLHLLRGTSTQPFIHHLSVLFHVHSKYAFTDKDRNKDVQIQTVSGGRKVYSMHGQRRIVVLANKLTAGTPEEAHEFTDGL